MSKQIYGLTKGTPLEKSIRAIANAEASGAKMYYAMARIAREQGLPEEMADTLERMADQESNHAGFYTILNGEVLTDLFKLIEQSAHGEYQAEKALSPIVQALRTMGSEEAAQQVEEFIRQETHHGEVLDELLKKFGPYQEE